jgi:hypothetical protein
MIDALIYGPEGSLSLPGFRITYVNDLSEIISYLSTITAPTVVISSKYTTYSPQLMEIVTYLIENKPSDVVLLAPYQLICSQLVTVSMGNLITMRVSDFHVSDLKFHGELYFPSITDKIQSPREVLNTVTIMPPPIRYRFSDINHLDEYRYDNPCYSKPSSLGSISIPYMLLIVLFLIIVLVLAWVAFQLRYRADDSESYLNR